MGTRPGQIGVALNLIAERDMIAAQVQGIAGASRRMTLASSGLWRGILNSRRLIAGALGRRR